MRRVIAACLAFVVIAVVATGRDVPTPPPEIGTPTPGSTNPESEQATFKTPVRATPDRGYTPIAGGAGHIYFVRDGHLWTIAPDGSGERQLTDRSITDQPSPSPDGKMLAWVSGKDLYVMPSTGGEARKLYTGELPEHQRVGWSPDGKLVGFFSFDVASMGIEQAWAAPVEGGEPMLLTTMTNSMGDRGPGYERTVQWAPDNRWVVVAGSNNPMRLMRWPLSTGRDGDVREVSGGEPDWSPDSRTLLYTETLNGAVLIYAVLQAEVTPFRNEKQLVGTGLSEHAQGPGPLWSPASVGADSDLLVYRSRNLSGEPTVAVRSRLGRDYNNLPNLTNNPSWSPNGDKLVVEQGSMSQDTLGPKWTPNGIGIATINLGGEHTLTTLVKDAQWPVWGR
jgi:Tol biopolymer transport system component